MNPLWMIVLFQVFAFLTMYVACRFTSRARIRANVRRFTQTSGTVRRCATTVQFQSAFGRSHVIGSVVDDMRQKEWQYLGAESVGFLDGMRSTGGALRLHFVRVDANRPERVARR